MAKWQGKSFPKRDPKKPPAIQHKPADDVEARRRRAEQIDQGLKLQIDESLVKRAPMERVKQ